MATLTKSNSRIGASILSSARVIAVVLLLLLPCSVSQSFAVENFRLIGSQDFASWEPAGPAPPPGDYERIYHFYNFRTLVVSIKTGFIYQCDLYVTSEGPGTGTVPVDTSGSFSKCFKLDFGADGNTPGDDYYLGLPYAHDTPQPRPDVPVFVRLNSETGAIRFCVLLALADFEQFPNGRWRCTDTITIGQKSTTSVEKKDLQKQIK